jgi:hypothetical protein
MYQESNPADQSLETEFQLFLPSARGPPELRSLKSLPSNVQGFNALPLRSNDVQKVIEKLYTLIAIFLRVCQSKSSPIRLFGFRRFASAPLPSP